MLTERVTVINATLLPYRQSGDEVGLYQFVFNAEDAGGQRAQAVTVTTTVGGVIYLPLVTRQ